MKIRILSLILALLMLAIPLVSCNKDEEENPDDDETAVDSLELVTKGVSNFVIVRDYKASKAVVDNVNALVESYDTFLNAEVEVRECFSDMEEEEDVVQENEILIGATNRPETAEVTNGMRSGDYCIKIINGKLVIAGGSDEATASAIVRFMGGFVSAQGDKNSVAAKNAVFSLVVDQKTADDYAAIGKYSYNTSVICDARVDSYALFYANSSTMMESYAAFALELQDYINKQTGYILDVYKDANDRGSDYKILIGDTTMTDDAIADKIGPDNYYIGLKATETGAVLTIIYGENARGAALKAFKDMMPALSEPGDLNVEDGYLATNLE